MKILGIETSCDETAAAVVEDGHKILSDIVVSQIDIHKVYGGVVPEVAARSHIEAIIPVIDKSVDDWSEIDAITVANTPGLKGSLLIGTLTARTLAMVKNIPFYPVNHIEAHVYASFLGDNHPEFPFISLVVSGGHTQIMLFRDHGDFEVLGSTKDDAVGEAFDKVAKILGLPYPGGPSISEAAKSGDSKKYHLPKPKMFNPLDFSFSGLKTALLRAVQADCGKDYTFPSNELKKLLNNSQKNDFAASFQKTACEVLTDKLLLAYEKYQPKSIVVAGGVAANQELRRQIAERLLIKAIFPAPKYCTDNAAMVASLGYFTALNNPPVNPRGIDVIPT
ncbi:tRNA (adenosine(37)-N6)-threonylcarbamoyltransferase complex transferase subunit TsaD [Ruminococcaceae bacterium OttesenSCG-928-A11]|nr:tRNA (adenosine(37)-N6)-threonylcarbamoyltransferase complex transferase subunit TsaD [Ruminococcaceae bacterium OttesenSCG-928-A11]